MTLLKELSSEKTWIGFLEYKKEKRQLSKKELKELESFIAEKKYLSITSTLKFGYPTKREISKMGSSKKRIVYSYSKDETWVLKLLAYLLYKYDDKIPQSCYSFRRNKTAKTAFDNIRKIKDLKEKYVLKLDIHNYFNSINAEKLISILNDVINDDRELYIFLCNLLRQNKAIYDDEVIEENRGAMAGVSLASFFANIYLADMDRKFEGMGIPYFRYSDDMIIFCDNQQQLELFQKFIEQFLDGMDLSLNMDKYHISYPHEKWEFLGFSYDDGSIDLSDSTVNKMKAKIRRKARKLYRWRMKKKAGFKRAAKAMINSFDHKFYDLTGNNDFTWTRFYFPVITKTDGLKTIDEYMLSYLRFLSSGRHFKGNYKVKYAEIKALGYTPLVAEYYRWKKDNERLDRQ